MEIRPSGPPSAPGGSQTAEIRPPGFEAPPVAARTVTAPPPTTASGCLAVNAVPFASVYVDGQHVGDTPKACLRVPVGERRIHFQANDQRSPERVVQVTERNTANNPVRLAYDFRERRYLDQ